MARFFTLVEETEVQEWSDLRCNSEATSHPSGIFSGVVDVATAGYLWVEATVTIRKGYSGWYHCGF